MTRDTEAGVPAGILSSPSLLFLYYRIEQIMGIRAPADALASLDEYLEKSCGASFVEDPGAYEKALTSRERIFEISKLLTVNETYFFREGIHFKLLSRHFLPRLAKLGRPIRICSAASSIGCEAYSIAMLLDHYAKTNQHAKEGPPLEFEIDAFDINGDVIETAKRARYTANALRTDGADWKYILDSYLVPDGNEFIVSREIRERVNFFPHNIMRGFEKQYDIIFFRNALIYFSNRNRLIVMDAITESLYHGGLLFLGVSETSSIRHPPLASRYLSDVFFFQKIDSPGETEILRGTRKPAPPAGPAIRRPLPADKKPVPVRPAPPPARPGRTELSIDCGEVAAILEQEEGAVNAKKVLETIAGGQDGGALSGGALAASVVFFLGKGDFDSASLALSRLEKGNTGAVTRFLRGEYYSLCGSGREAEKSFGEAAGHDKAFWPAFYRISSLAAEGNRTRYEYKLKKTLESLELGRDMRYECFFGGFSPDYFRQIIERKLGEPR